MEQDEQRSHAPVAHGADHQRAGVLQLDVAEAPRAVGLVEGRVASDDPEGLAARILDALQPDIVHQLRCEHFSIDG
jgi:hypothetical protein